MNGITLTIQMKCSLRRTGCHSKRYRLFLAASLFLPAMSGAAQAPPQVFPSAPGATYLQVPAAGNQQQHQLQSAEADARQALLRSPGSLAALTRLAAVLQQEGQAAAAVHFWQQALALAPADAQLCAALANAYLSNGDAAKAIPLLQNQLKHPATDDGALWLDLGTALARQDRYEEAAHAYESALQFPPYADLAQLSLAKALLTLNRYAQAAPHAIAFAGAHPADYEAHAVLGITEEGLGNLPQAEAQLRLATAENANDYDSQYHLGAVLRAQGKTQQAVDPLLRAVALRPNAQEAHFQLARAYRATHQAEAAAHEEAILVALVKAKQTDTQVEVLGNQASQATIAGSLEQAAQLYRQILALRPANAQAAYDLALIYERQHDRKAERTLLEQAAMQPNAIANIYSQLGFLDVAEGEKAVGEQQLHHALQLDPQCVEALGNLGVLAAQSGHPEESVRFLQLAVEANPQYEQGFRNLGLVLADNGDRDRASKALHAALALQPGDTTATRALAAITAAQ